MKKIFLFTAALVLAAPTISSCRDENDKDIEVENLKPDAEDSSDDESYRTNPVPSDDTPYEPAGTTSEDSTMTESRSSTENKMGNSGMKKKSDNSASEMEQ